MLLIGAFRGRPGGLIALGLVSSLGLLVTSIVGAATGGTVDNRELLVRPSPLRWPTATASRTARS